MYNKLHNRYIKVLLNLLLGLPVLFFVADILLGKIFKLSLPFKKYILYVAFATILAHSYYRYLMPLHETGHYLITLFFKNKNHLDVDIWIDKKHTSCSRWKEYNDREAKIILCAGMFFKLIYCIGIIFVFAKLNIKFGMITFTYVIWFEIILNALPILKESDGYKIKHIDDFYNEEKREKNIREELFVKKVYPWILVGITIISIGFLHIADKVLLYLGDFL